MYQVELMTKVSPGILDVTPACRNRTVDLYFYAGQDHFFDRDPRCSEAVANAMAFFMARYASAAMTSA